MRLEEEVRKGQVLQGHLVLDADGQRVDRLGEVLLRPDLRAQDAERFTVVDQLEVEGLRGLRKLFNRFKK